MRDTAPPRAHQFEDAGQQFDASVFGMWIFLVTEVLFFGGLFAAYAVYRWSYPEAFKAASHTLDINLGFLNTMVLIASSLTMAMAVHASQLSKKKALLVWLGLTILLGTAFLGVKAVEYSHKFQHHLVPGVHFSFPEYTGHGSQLFFSLYFAMTGLHALHMIIGIGLLLALVVMAARGTFDENYHNPVEITGLYWHFVDIVWIFLFPLLYLIGRHG